MGFEEGIERRHNNTAAILVLFILLVIVSVAFSWQPCQFSKEKAPGVSSPRAIFLSSPYGFFCEVRDPRQ